jgi:hypothetical protein
MPILVVLGSSVWELWGVQILGFPFKTYMAYNNLPSTTVQACDNIRCFCTDFEFFEFNITFLACVPKLIEIWQ